MFVPGWWARAYLDSVRVNAAGSDFDCLQAGGVLPSLRPHMLDRLAVVLNSFQSQLLVGTSKEIIFRPSAFSKQLATKSESSHGSWEQLFATIGGIRLLGVFSDQCETVYRLFQSEKWGTDEEGRFVHFKLGFDSEELLLGYLDPYRDWLRRSSGKQSLAAFFEASEVPLIVWKSIWADLTGVEKRIFLDLMRMQEKGVGLVGLEGETVTDFEHICAGVLPSKKSLKSKSFFLKKLRYIELLNKKLVEHGFSRWCCDSDVTQEPLLSTPLNGLGVHWFADLNAQLNSKKEHESQINRLFVTRLFRAKTELIALFKLFSNDDSDFSQLAREIGNFQEESLKEDKGDFVTLNGNKVVSLFLLYLEWSIRALVCRTGKGKLPDSITFSPIIDYMPGSLEKRAIFAHYEKFLAEFKMNSQYVTLLTEQEPGVSLALENETAVGTPTVVDRTASSEQQNLEQQTFRRDNELANESFEFTGKLMGVKGDSFPETAEPRKDKKASVPYPDLSAWSLVLEFGNTGPDYFSIDRRVQTGKNPSQA